MPESFDVQIICVLMYAFKRLNRTKDISLYLGILTKQAGLCVPV